MMDMFFPPGASAHAASIDRMVDWVHILMLILFVAWGAYFLYVLARFRRGKNPKANYHGTKGKASKYAEVGVALAEVVLLVGFSIPLRAPLHPANTQPGSGAAVSVTTSLQWKSGCDRSCRTCP